MSASGHVQRPGSSFRRVTVYGAAGTIAFGLIGLLGYVPGMGSLGSIREGYIPMAPSTAISFIVLGSVLCILTLRSLSGASLALMGALAALISLFGVLEFAGHFAGKDLSLEDTLFPTLGNLGEIPIGRMSPSTGALFFLAGLSAFVLVSRRRRPHSGETRLRYCGDGLGILVSLIGLAFSFAYLYGSPLLYGKGATIPMALTTAIAFAMLGVATVTASGEDGILVPALDVIRRLGKSASERSSFIVLTIIMIVACTIIMTVVTMVLYRHSIDQHREQLQVTAQSKARLIEAIARFDLRWNANYPEGPSGRRLEPDR